MKIIHTNKAKETFLKLTTEQRQEIINSKKDIKKGHFLDQLELDKSVEEWLKKVVWRIK
jgi:Mg/Co/Ni transporter MgtE